MTTREKLNRLVDELSEAEVEAALTPLVREREAVEQWAAAEDAAAVEMWRTFRAPAADGRHARRGSA